MSFSFGTPNTQQKPPAFGAVAPAATPGSNFSFGGTGAATSTPAPSFGGFGATTTSALSFGTPSTATVAPLNFGTSTTTSTASSGLGGTSFSLGQPPAQTSTSFGLAQPSTQPSLSFGQPQAASGFSLGGAQPNASNTLSLNKPGSLFGAAAPQTAAPASGFTLGGTPAAPALVATTAASIGLGGTNIGIGTSASVTAPTDNKSTTAQNQKETAIPNELLESVEEFKKFVKEERSISSDVAHASPKIHNKIKEEISAMNQLVSTLMTGLSRNHALLDKIKVDAAQEILNAEIAQRTKDTPRGLQYENMAPYEFFSRLVAKFEGQMMHYRRQIEETEQHLISMASGQAMTPEDVARALQKLHSAFVGLAGGYQNIHEQVFALTESFNQWHRQRYGSTLEVYPSKKKNQAHQSNSFATGPSPFTGKDLFSQAKAALIAQVPSQVPQNPNMSTLVGGGNSLTNPSQTFNLTMNQPNTQASTGGLFSFNNQNQNTNQGLFGTAVSPFGATGTTSTFQTGGKRGKH